MDIERTMLWAGLLGFLAIGLALFTAFQRMAVDTALGGDDDLLVKKSSIKTVSDTKISNTESGVDKEKLKEVLQELQELKRLILDSDKI